MADPPMPENVRIVLQDGTEVPVEMIYDGIVEGVHRWRAVAAVRQPPKAIMVDVMPEGVSIVIDAEFEESEEAIRLAEGTDWIVNGATLTKEVPTQEPDT